MRWTLVIPAKSLPAAKSRLRPASGGTGGHDALVEAIRLDTVEAARAAAGVCRILLVTDAPAPADQAAPPGAGASADHVLAQRSAGLNGALRDAAAHAARHWPDDGVAVLVGDLPALRPDELGAALVAAARHSRAFAADASGTGTTLLTASPGTPLDPSFGPDSAARHARAAYRLDVGPSLRCDVDTEQDLAAAQRLGLRRHTARIRAGSAGPGSPAVHDGVA